MGMKVFLPTQLIYGQTNTPVRCGNRWFIRKIIDNEVIVTDGINIYHPVRDLHNGLMETKIEEIEGL